MKRTIAALLAFTALSCCFFANTSLRVNASDPETDVSSIDYGNEDLMELIILYAFIAMIALLIFILLLRWISNIQGTFENMKEIF